MSALTHRKVSPSRSARFSVPMERLEGRRLLSSGGYNFQTVAALGDPIGNPVPPLTAAGGNFVSDFELGGLNDRGQLGFTSEQGTAAGDQGEGVFVSGPNGTGPIKTLNLPGQSAPGGGGVFGGFGTFSRDAINNKGEGAFAAALVAP